MPGKVKAATTDLARWTPEHRDYYVQKRISGHSQRHSWRLVLEEFPDAHPYSYVSVYRYEKRPEIAKMIADAREALNRRISEHSAEVAFAGQGGRVHALSEQAEELLDRRRAILSEGGKDIDLTRVSSEFRNTLSAIREEIGPAKEATLSWFDEFAKAYEAMKEDKGAAN